MRSALSKILFKRCFYHPIFVVGTGRSGTSVLLQALGEHPCILSMPGEAPLLTSFGAMACLFEFGEDRDYYNASLKVSKEYLYRRLRRLCFETSGSTKLVGRELLADVVKRRTFPWKKRFWCAKTFPSEKVAKGLLCLYPAGKFIYIIRNGVDVVHSMTKFVGFREREFTKQCMHWSDEIGKYRYFSTCDAAVVVRHEDLTSKPETVFERIFSFIGVGRSKEPIDFIKTNLVHPLDSPTRNVSSVREALTEREPPYKVWSPEQREVFKNICGAAMNEAGYSLTF